MDDQDFYEEHKETFLRERTEYRTTGIKKKDKRKEVLSL